MSLAQKIPIMRREVEIRAEVPEYKSRFGVAIDKELEAARARFTPRDGDGPSDYHKLTQDQKALFNIALNAERLKAELSKEPAAGLPRLDQENGDEERAQARWDSLSATTRAGYVVQYAHDGRLPAHEREYAAQAARFDWTKESAALAKEWEKLSPEQRKAELDAYKAALATPRHPYEHHIRTEFANELKGLAEHGPQFPGLANVRELKGRDGVSQEAGGRAAYSSPAPTTPGTVALNPKAAEALDRMGHRSSPDLGNAWAGERTSRAPKPKSVELGDR